jgi:energy-coupling factor transporter ATP-binding protein EcfA2
MPPVPTLALRAVSKSFGMTAALSDMTLELFPGEVHAIVGENGAGKSTMIKIMTGIHQPSSGRVEIDGAPVVLSGSKAARLRGEGLVEPVDAIDVRAPEEQLTIYARTEVPVVLEALGLALEQHHHGAPPGGDVQGLVGRIENENVAHASPPDGRHAIHDGPIARCRTTPTGPRGAESARWAMLL